MSDVLLDMCVCVCMFMALNLWVRRMRGDVVSSETTFQARPKLFYTSHTIT